MKRKRLLSLLLAISMVLTLIPSLSFADEMEVEGIAENGYHMTLECESKDVTVAELGETFELTVTITENTKGFYTAGTNVLYNHDILELVGVKDAMEGVKTNQSNTPNDIVIFQNGELENVLGTGDVLKLVFKTKAVGETNVNLKPQNDDADNIAECGEDIETVYCTFIPGTVKVSLEGEEAKHELTVKQPDTFNGTQGQQITVDLEKIFSDEENHKIDYTMTPSKGEVYNSFTKLSEGKLYFTASEAGEYHPIITATCSDGATATVTLAINIETGEEGLPIQYGYDESPAESVTIYLTISSDGVPLKGNDTNETVLSHLEVEVPYFDLEKYGLAEFYRFPKDGDSADVIERPTAMHAFIYALERYYMGVPEDECATGEHNPVGADGGYGVCNLNENEAYEDTLNCVLYTGTATSTYMQHFWGHDENLMYYRNHVYPLMAPGWGSTSDYILLSDGDTLDLAMFSDWGFYQHGAFLCFGGLKQPYEPIDTYKAAAGEPLEFSLLAFGTQAVADGGVDNFVPALDGEYVLVYNSNWEFIDVAEPDEEKEYIYNYTFEKPGTYYLLGLDLNAEDCENAAYAPATAKVVVKASEGSSAETDQAVADAVIAKIESIGEVTLESEAVIAEARTAYNALTEEQKALVTNYETLTAAEAEYAELKAAAEQAEKDQAAAQKVIDEINQVANLPSIPQPQFFGPLEQTRAHYDALTDAQKELVTNYEVLVNKEAEMQLAKDKIAADKAIKAIKAIKKVEYTEASKVKIVEARTAYDALTEAQKALVTNYETLTAAEAEYAELKAAAEAAQKEADAVIAKIESIGEVTLESEAVIAEARTAYDALTEEQKVLVTNYETLIAAEAKYEELKAEEGCCDADNNFFCDKCGIYLGDEETYTQEVRLVIPEGAAATFYCGSEGEGFPIAAEDKGMVGSHHIYEITVPYGKYSCVVKDDEHNYGGVGFDFPLQTSIYEATNLTLVLVKYYTTTTSTKINGVSTPINISSIDDFDVDLVAPGKAVIIPGENYLDSTIKEGTTYVVAPRMVWAYGNQILYNYTVKINNEDLAKIVGAKPQINGTFASTVTSVQKKTFSLSALTKFELVAPTSANTEFFYQINNFNDFKFGEDSVSSVDNGDGTTTYTVTYPDFANASYRVSQDGYITQAGYAKNNTSYEVKLKEGNPGDISTAVDSKAGAGSNIEYENSVYLNVDDTKDTNELAMNVGETFRLRGFRAAWEIVNTVTANIMIEPDFHYEVLEGSDVVSVTPVTSQCTGNARGNWMDIKALKEGTALIAVWYDAIDIGGNTTLSGRYGATDPARYGYVLVNVGKDTNVEWNPVSHDGDWDAEFDTVYYFGENGTFTCSPTGAEKVTVKNFNGTNAGAEVTVEAEEGKYNIPVYSGSNLVTVKTAAGNDYMLVRAKKIECTIENETTGKTDKDEDFEISVGDDVVIHFNQFNMPVAKMSGIYNPGYTGTAKTYYTLNGLYNLSSVGTQYDYITDAKSCIKFKALIPGENILSDGYIQSGSMGDNFGNHRNIADGGRGTNFSAVNVTGYFGSIEDIKFFVGEKESTVADYDLSLSKLTIFVGESTYNHAGIFNLSATATKPIDSGSINWAKSTETMMAQPDNFALKANVTTKTYYTSVALRYWYDGEEPQTVKMISGSDTIIPVGKNFRPDADRILNIEVIVTPGDPKAGNPKVYSYVYYPGNENLKYVHPILSKLTVKSGNEGLSLISEKGEGIYYTQTEYELHHNGVTTLSLEGQQLQKYTNAKSNTQDKSDTVIVSLEKNGSVVGNPITVLPLTDDKYPVGKWTLENLDIENADTIKINVKSYVNDTERTYTINLINDNQTVDETVDEVISLISAIETVTLESEAAIVKAREAYDALTDAQKALVTNYETLTAAETKYAELKAAAEKPASGGGGSVSSGSADSPAPIVVDIAEEKVPLAEMPTLTVKVTDIAGKWYESAATFVASRGLMTGVTATDFGGDLKLTTAQVSTVLARLDGEDAETSWNESFAKYGKESIDREAAVVMLYAFAKEHKFVSADFVETGKASAELAAFVDASTIDAANIDAVNWAISIGLLKGVGSNKLDNKGQLTRAQFATLLERYVSMATEKMEAKAGAATK